MRYLKLILITVISLSALPALALPPAEELPGIERYTDLGGGLVRQERGRLFFREGFIPFASFEGVFSITPEVLAAVSGKTVISLALYTSFSNLLNLKNFQRSVETYSINDVPYVIVSVDGAKPTKPRVSISAVDAGAAEEAQATGEFMIALNTPTSRNIIVKFKIAGTAKKGKDYQSFPAKLLIPAGNVSGIIEVLPVDDTAQEQTETVILKLKSGKRYKVRSSKKATVRIFDND